MNRRVRCTPGIDSSSSRGFSCTPSTDNTSPDRVVGRPGPQRLSGIRFIISPRGFFFPRFRVSSCAKSRTRLPPSSFVEGKKIVTYKFCTALSLSSQVPVGYFYLFSQTSFYLDFIQNTACGVFLNVQKLTKKHKLLFFPQTHSSQVTPVNKFLGYLKMLNKYFLNA